jgi:hypothetical protein
MKFRLQGNVTIPQRPTTVGGLVGWARKVNRTLQELRDRKVVGTVATAKSGNAKPPLWITLKAVAGDPVTWEVFAEYGHVVPRHNASDQTGAPIEITSLPTPDAPMTVAEDDKLWVKLAIDVSGKVTTATFEKGAAWIDDTPPELIGGDDQTGTAGIRRVRIAEIIANPDSIASPAPLISDQLHTGHVDYSQPELIENLTTSPSTNEARVMKEWNTSEGRWDMRYLIAGDGIEITENASTIEVSVATAYAPSHPWKASPNGNAFINISRGHIMGFKPYSDGTYGTASFFLPFIEILQTYAGGSVEITNATGFIYATCTVTSSVEGQEGAYAGGDLGGDLYRPSAAPTVVFSSVPIASYAPLDAKVHFLIAEVSLAGGIAAVEEQLLFHNPSIQLDGVFNIP